MAQQYEQPQQYPQPQQSQPAQQPMMQQNNMEYQNGGNVAYTEKPTRSFGSKWTFGFWDCCSPMSTCCLGCWCPCILYGKTQARLEGDQEASGCGLMCCAYYALLHFGGHSCLQAITRNKMRHQYNIDGNGCMDWVGACCCPCCGLIQEEKEALLRTTGVDAKTQQQYQAPAGMAYP